MMLRGLEHQLFINSDLAVAIDTLVFKSKLDVLHYQTLDAQFNLGLTWGLVNLMIGNMMV